MLQALNGRRNEGGCPPLLWSAAPLPPGRGAAQWVLAFPFRRPIAKAPGSAGQGRGEGRRRRAGTPARLRPRCSQHLAAASPACRPSHAEPRRGRGHRFARDMAPRAISGLRACLRGSMAATGKPLRLRYLSAELSRALAPRGCLGNNCAAPASFFIGASLKWPQGCCLLDNPGARDIVFSQAFGPRAAPTDRPAVSA
jgi:hypothetical protein